MDKKTNKSIKKNSVLVVEDDRFLNKAYADKLGREGFNVFLATSADEAWDQLKAKKPDIIMLDVIMPGTSGFEFLGDLKKNIKFKKIPVLIVSNLSQEEDIAKGKEMGAADYLIKTELTLDEIVGKVKSAIKKNKF